MKLLLEVNKRKLITVLLLVLLTSCKERLKKENIKVFETSRVENLPYYNEETFTIHIG